MTETFLFLDTETTGFKKSGSLVQKGQARVCQIAMILADDKGKTLAEYQSLIRPNNWDLNGATHNYFGIPYADCLKHGVHHSKVMGVFYSLASGCSQIVAHNAKFDKGMMDVERAYHDYQMVMTGSEVMSQAVQWYCTMTTNKHIANGKWPKLVATLKHYTGKDLVDAHDAMADTRACRDIFFAMRGVKL